MPKNTDPDFAARLATVLAGEGDGTETTEIDGELNNEGGPKMIHHFKGKKVYIRGRGEMRQTVPDAEAKEHIANLDRNN